MKDASARILDLIDQHCQVALQDGKRRTHLGASRIGHECSRAVWYEFRWVAKEEFSGRVLRLFNRGHLEEARFVGYLRGIGCVVADVDPVTGDQFRVKGVMGHFGGSCDGQALLPPEICDAIGIPHNEPVLLEFKTESTKSFPNTQSKGVQRAKPVHWAQMCVYGFLLRINFCLYIVVDKNTDELHVELVKLDKYHGKAMIDIAQGVIAGGEAPVRTFPASHQSCKFCSFKANCHFGKPFDKNCRSCKYAQPVCEGKWACHKHKGIIPEDFIPEGCPDWESLSNV